MLLEVIDFVLTCESVFSDWSNDLHFRRQNLEYDVESHLIISGSCTAVSHISGSDLPDVLQHFESLEHPFRTHRKRICRILEYIAVDQILYSLAVICTDSIHCRVRCRSE